MLVSHQHPNELSTQVKEGLAAIGEVIEATQESPVIKAHAELSDMRRRAQELYSELQARDSEDDRIPILCGRTLELRDQVKKAIADLTYQLVVVCPETGQWKEDLNDIVDTAVYSVNENGRGIVTCVLYIDHYRKNTASIQLQTIEDGSDKVSIVFKEIWNIGLTDCPYFDSFFEDMCEEFTYSTLHEHELAEYEFGIKFEAIDKEAIPQRLTKLLSILNAHRQHAMSYGKKPVDGARPLKKERWLQYLGVLDQATDWSFRPLDESYFS